MPETDTNINEQGIPQIVMSVSPSSVVQAPTDKTLSVSEMPADAKVTGDAIRTVADDLSDLASDVSGLLANAIGTIFPVGAIYVTAGDDLPDALQQLGDWMEIAIPLTWGDIKRGTRSYAEPETGYTGTIHFWLRTT